MSSGFGSSVLSALEGNHQRTPTSWWKALRLLSDSSLMSYKVIALLHVNRNIALTAKILWNVKDGNGSFYVLANRLCEMGRAVTPKFPLFYVLGNRCGFTSEN